MSLEEVADVLRAQTAAGARIPTKSVDFTVPGLGTPRPTTSAKARRLLGWDPRPNERVLIDTAESLLLHGLLRAGS